VDAPAPAATELAPHRAYLDRLAAGVLAYQRCRDCGAAIFPPRVLCPACGSVSLDWRESEGRGAVYSSTAIPTRDSEPYDVALIDLDEGYRMMSTVVGLPADRVAIGMRVRVRIEPGDAERDPRPVFEPEANDAR
jgi:uncharacterized OB-fold protein